MTSSQDESITPSVERILDAAAEVFAEKGFGGARVDEIAARAGINKALLYYHVGDKAAMYSAVLSRNLSRAHRAIAAATQAPAPPEARLRAFIGALVELVEHLPHHPRIMLREVAGGGVNLPVSVARQMAGILEVVRGILEEGVATGVFRSVSPLRTHLLILGAVTIMTASRPVRDRIDGVAGETVFSEPSEPLAEYLSNVILNGIAVGGGTP